MIHENAAGAPVGLLMDFFHVISGIFKLRNAFYVNLCSNLSIFSAACVLFNVTRSKRVHVSCNLNLTRLQ